MATFVSFPGVAGNYVSTADVNLVDADTAHMYQSLGRWDLYSQRDEPAAFSGKGVEVDLAGLTNNATMNGSDSVALTAATDYTVLTYVEPQDGLDRTYLYVEFYDAGLSLLGNSGVLDDQNPTPVGRQLRVGTFTTPANTAWGKLRIYYRDGSTGAPISKTLKWDSVMIAAGSVASFVPSLRIVGDLDLRAEAAIDTSAGVFNEGINAGNSYRMAPWEDDMFLFVELAGGNENVAWSASRDGDRHHYVVTRDAATGVCELTIDGISQGTKSTTVGAVVPLDLPAVVGDLSGALGARSLLGSVYSMEIRDGVDGPIVALFDPTDITGSSRQLTDGQTWEGNTGRTWTVTGSGLTFTKATLLDEVASYLVANTTMTVGGSTGTLTKAIMRDSQPDTVATLLETGGLPSVQTYSTGNGAEIAYERPSFQLLSRSTSYQVARGVAETVYTTLDGLGATTMTGTRYLSVDAVQAPFSLGRDENERYLVSVNFQTKKEVS